MLFLKSSFPPRRRYCDQSPLCKSILLDPPNSHTSSSILRSEKRSQLIYKENGLARRLALLDFHLQGERSSFESFSSSDEKKLPAGKFCLARQYFCSNIAVHSSLRSEAAENFLGVSATGNSVTAAKNSFLLK